MKIKTNLRAGKQSQNGKTADATDTSGTTDTSGSINNTVVSYYNPPVSRCPGY